MAASDALAAVRNPAFTGDARCWPCTVLNAVLLWVGVTIVVLIGHPLLAAGLAAAGIGAIWLRGYLVPSTPQFAPQFVSALPGDPFDHDREPGSLADAVDVDLLEGDAPDGGRLDAEVRTAWRTSAARYRSLARPELAARVADRIPGGGVGRAQVGAEYVVLEGPDGQVLCPRPIAVADLAAIDALEEAGTAGASDGTAPPAESPPGSRERLAATDPFRARLETCPLCEGDLAVSRSACCGAAPPGTATDGCQLVCEACPVRLYVCD